MEPVNLDKPEPVNVSPVQSGRPARPSKPKRQRKAKERGGPPDLTLVISAIAVMVLLLVGGTYAVGGIISTAKHACEQTNSDSCDQPGISTGWDVPIFP
ncbi:hypothetical protein [Curtobacterium sp. MCSS17_016]|uniref:hypothetical protein n=1 Tax=Curtobacterium sp. MCSS17_016 TaxID=2175644 RepID=UPI000DA9CA8E|nr:hypothetical protein [Curtobacterium sp. MCSS17_016]WIE81406.1 hypothetical protein DEJ19_019415 [Curtobacterium sp. MCSS17_016]